MSAKQLIAYIRVSRVGDRDVESDSFQTVEQQREAIEAIAKLSGGEVVDVVVALNASGGKDWPEKKLKEAIARVDRGEADGIAVYDLSRWGRSLDALKVIERWTEEGKTMVSAADKFDASTPSGVMCLTMMMAVARYYWQTAKARFFDSQKDAIEERGLWVGAAPFGYLRPAVGTKKNGKPEFGPLVEDPDEGPIVREAYKIAAGEGFRAATRYLERNEPRREWRAEVVRRLLSSRVYLGEAFLGKLVKTDAHEPLTTPELHAAIETLPEMSARPRRASGDYVLSGIARCGRCGGPMIGQLQKVGGVRRRRLRCGCGGGASITADGLEAFVKGRVGVALAGRAEKLLHDPGSGLDEAREALATAEAERDRFATDLEIRDVLGDEAWRKGATARAKAVEDAREIYQELASKTARTDWLFGHVELDDPDQLARAIRTMIDSITVKPGRGTPAARATITWKALARGTEPARPAESPFYSNAPEATVDQGWKAIQRGRQG